MTTLPRRQFLLLGSAAVAGIAASSLSADVFRGALASAPAPASRLSLGFVDATLDELIAPEAMARVFSANRLHSGDTALGDAARLQIHGRVASGMPLATGVDAFYHVGAVREAVPFFAATFSGPSAIPSTRSTPFVVPVSAAHPLTLSVAMKSSSAQTAHAKVALSPGRGFRTNKLRRGVYFLAVPAADGTTPDWSSVRAIAPAAGRLPSLVQVTLTGAQPVPFEYIVFTADRA